MAINVREPKPIIDVNEYPVHVQEKPLDVRITFLVVLAILVVIASHLTLALIPALALDAVSIVVMVLGITRIRG